MLDHSGFLQKLRAATTADPTFLPAHVDYLWHHRRLGDTGQLRRDYPPPGDGAEPLDRCLHAAATAPRGVWTPAADTLLALESERGATACTAVFLSDFASRVSSRRPWSRQDRQRAEAAVRLAPEVWLTWIDLSNALGVEARWQEADSVLQEGARTVPHPLQRLELQIRRVGVLLNAGDTARARGLHQALTRAAQRDGRAALRQMALSWRTAFAVTGDERRSIEESTRPEMWRLLELHGDATARWLASMAGGVVSMDRIGDPEAALRSYERALGVARNLGRDALILQAQIGRGRALAKLGRLDEAEPALLEVRDLATAMGEPYWLAEAHHNLAHVHEGRGDLAAAARSAARFATTAEILEGVAIRVMGYRDAGLINWKAGWHAAADDAFRHMVRVIEEHAASHYWAGEFYERIGELDQALEHYSLGAMEPSGERLRDLAGLARVHLALGQLDSAAVAARAHDAFLASPVAVPLLPEIMARAGRPEAGAEVSRATVERRLAAGNVEGATVALLQLAELLLEAGRPEEAGAKAREALDLGASLNLTDGLIRGRRLAGLSELALGRAEAAIRLVEGSLALLDDHPLPAEEVASRLALGDARFEAGDEDGALDAWDGAARAVEAVTVRLEPDLERARYRSENLAPFDRAVTLLLGRARDDPEAVDPLLGWLQRRTAAGLVLAGHPRRPGAAPPLTSGQVMSRLGQGEALIHYVTVDSVLAAVVATQRGIRVRRLAASVESTREWIERLRRPLATVRAGNVDLARAPYDLGLAHHLYAALLRPLEHLVGESGTLFIVPDGPVHRLPLGALVSAPPPGPGRYAEARYVLDDRDVAYLPSLRALAAEVGDPSDRGRLDRVVVAAYETPGGSVEAESIARVLGPSVQTLVQEAATETAVRHATATATLLHVAAHAQARADDPLASHLRLAPDSTNDGFFQYSEVLDQGNGPELVVLSACETGSGPVFAAEGPLSLARAFLAAGSRGVVATHWPTGGAYDLMEAFYGELAVGASLPSALSRARRTVRGRPATAHPFYWAAFVLVEGRTQGQPSAGPGI